jgi:hypothetical protein
VACRSNGDVRDGRLERIYGESLVLGIWYLVLGKGGRVSFANCQIINY